MTSINQLQCLTKLIMKQLCMLFWSALHFHLVSFWVSSLLMQSMQAYDVQSFVKIMAIFPKIYGSIAGMYNHYNMTTIHNQYVLFCSCIYLCSNCTDMKSTMAQFMRLKTIKGRKVEIINTISADWKEFAFLMDFIQRPRQRLQRLKQRMHKLREMVYSSAVRKCLCIVKKNKKKKTEATWGNLIGLLYDFRANCWTG